MKSTKEFIKTFIKECQSNRNGQYAAILKRDYSEIYNQIISEYPAPKPAQSLYNFVNDITTFPVCIECQSPVKFINYTKGYHQFCGKKCGDNSKQTKDKRRQSSVEKCGHINYLQSNKGKEARKQHMIKKYGVEHFSKTEEFKQQFTSTMKTRYGVEYAMQSEELQERHKQTLRNNYGVDHPYQSLEIYEKRRQTLKNNYGVEYAMQSKELQEKHRQVMQDKYGVDRPIQNQEIHNKMKQTMMDRYGREYSAQVDYIFEKLKQTNINKYGVEFPLQNEDIQSKQKQTNIDKYGVEYPLQNEDIKQKKRHYMEKQGKWIPLELLSDAELYYKLVWKYTRKQPIDQLLNFQKRGLAGIEGAYHLDHKISIKYGFENNIPPYIVGSIHNLEMLPWKDNVYKSSKCSIAPVLLFELYFFQPLNCFIKY